MMIFRIIFMGDYLETHYPCRFRMPCSEFLRISIISVRARFTKFISLDEGNGRSHFHANRHAGIEGLGQRARRHRLHPRL